MWSIKQQFRQPIRSIMGVLLIAVAVSILVTCVGQYAATNLTRANLDDRYDTVGLLSDNYFWTSSSGIRQHNSALPEDIQTWINTTIQNRTDLIKEESYTEVYSAYVHAVSPDNFSQYENGDWMDYNSTGTGVGNPYRCAMLEVTLTAIGTIVDEDTVSYGSSMEDMQKFRKNISVMCTGTVERVIGLEQGFKSPVGKTIALTISVYSEDELDTMELEVGQRYLVYGMDYSDVQGNALYSCISSNPSMYEELFGAADMGLNGPEYDNIAEQVDCYMSVCDYSALPIIYNNNGSFETRFDFWKNYTKTESGISMQYAPAEGLASQYKVPTITKLAGTAGDFLASENGGLWRQVLDEMEISNHGFPVLAVDKLGYQIAFSRGESRITEGRDFTEAELMQSSNVCIISESVATINGLSIGDSIPMQTYGFDPNIEVQRSDLISGTCFPSAAVYSRRLGFTSEVGDFTIVGIYRQNNAWQNHEDSYGLTPNVIFVPKGSISGDARIGIQGIFYTLVLRNGRMQDFQTLQKEAGYPNLFICLDQGYTEIAAGLDAYEGVSTNALYIGIAGCIVILILFLILFPCQQGKTLATMSSLGASRGKRICHIVVSTVCLLIPGAAIGGLAGSHLWKRVAETLMESVNVQIPLEANVAVFAPSLTLLMLGMMSVMVFLLAVVASSDRGLMRRK